MVMSRLVQFHVVVAVAAVLAAVIFRVGLSPHPTVSPDGELYMRIARNIVLNRCYSDSPPEGAACRPTWGNQPPGYPAFVAAVSVPAVPSMIAASAEELPPGIVRFWRVAAVTQTATSAILWNVWNRRYGVIKEGLDDGSVSRRVDAGRLHSAIHALSSVPDGHVVPPDIDWEFEGLAGEFAGESLVYRAGILPAERAAHMWLDEDVVNFSGWHWRRSTERYVRLYRVALLGLALGAPLVFWRHGMERVLVGGVALLVAVRALFLVGWTALETRYVTPGIPAMELAAGMVVAGAFAALRPMVSIPRLAGLASLTPSVLLAGILSVGRNLRLRAHGLNMPAPHWAKRARDVSDPRPVPLGPRARMTRGAAT